MKRAHVFAVAMLVIVACGGEEDSVDETGWGKLAVRASLDGESAVFDQASAAVHGGATVVNASRSVGAQSLELSFPGAARGDFDCDSGATISYAASAETRYAALGGEGACAIAVTAYGAVGEPVAGTFTGTLVRVSGVGPASLSVTAGSFEAARGADVD